MTEQHGKRKIFFSAAEASGDLHCAGLISALKKTGYEFEAVGIGGARMEEAGCQLLARTADKGAIAGKAFSRIGHFYMLIRRINAYLKSNKPDLVVVCDSPAFNFHIAKIAKKIGSKTLFFVAPQLWAWAPWRIEKLRKTCDKLCCILPFEEKWFMKRGIDITFVGNPMLDNLPADLSVNIKKYTTYNPPSARIALLPGSRSGEIASLWRPMQEIAAKLKTSIVNARFTAIAADSDVLQVLKNNQVSNFDCEYTIAAVTETAIASDFAIVASGSATIQVAAAGCPMVVMYQTNRFMWHLVARWLLTTKYLSLVNILARKELVPEFMPYFTSIEPIFEKVLQQLNDPEGLAKTSESLVKLAGRLRKGEACENTARIVVQMLS